MMKMRIRAMRMTPRRIVMEKKMKNRMVAMISLEKSGRQKIPPRGRNANADHPSRASGFCHLSKRQLWRALTCPTRSVHISCAYMSAQNF
jgi:hypothetical protein